MASGRPNVVTATLQGIYRMDPEGAAALLPDRITVSVVGCGYIGSCIGATLAAKGVRVVGIDVDPRRVAEISGGTISIAEPRLSGYVKRGHEAGTLTASTDFEPVAHSDIVLVTVGTPLSRNGDPDLERVRSACQEIGRYLARGCLVMLKSTVPPLTTEEVVRPVLEEGSGLKAGTDFGLVFSPERLSEGNAIQELETIPIVIGGIDRRSSEIAALFWSRTLGVETIIVGRPATAEMVKLADNQWIDLNIALANEIACVCDKLGIDAFEVIRAANTLPKGQSLVNILWPSMGVGGYCLSKDPWFFHRLGREVGVELRTPVCSRSVNESMPDISFERVRSCLEASGTRVENARVAVLGVAYKNNTGDVRFTPVEPFLQRLEASGCAIRVYDPLAGPESIRRITSAEICGDIRSAVTGADLVACLAAHDEFVRTPLRELKALTNDPCWFFDGRRRFDPHEVAATGFQYTAVGSHCYHAS